MKDDTPPGPDSSRPPLERSSDHRVVAGVCGGLGRHLDIDPVVFRVVIAVLSLWGGVGLFIYGMAWLIVPLEGTGRSELRRLLSGRVDGQSLGAVLVTVLGSGIFFTYMGSSGHIFPLLLIALLSFAALRYDPEKFASRRRQSPPPDSQSTTAPTDAEPAPPPAPAWWQRPDPLRKPTPMATMATGTAEAPADAVPDLQQPFTATAPAWTPPAPPSPPPPPSAPRRAQHPTSYLSSIFFCLAVITGGAVWFAGERPHHNVNLLAVLASGLLVLGLGLLLGARWGRARGLVLWATLLTLAVAAVGASPVRLDTTFQHVSWTPASAATLQPDYRLSSGKAELNLRAVAPTAGQTLTTRVTLGAGKLLVVLPDGPDSPEVRLTVHAGVGEVQLPDGTQDGGVSPTRTTVLNPAAAEAHGTIDLDLSVGAGQVEVTR